MANAVMTQMNVRIDEELKKRGDAGLAEMGFTPSSAVRALWSQAALRGENAERLRKALAGEGDLGADAATPQDGSGVLDPEIERKLAAHHAARQHLEEVYRGFGLTVAPAARRGGDARESMREAYLDAMEARMRERSLR